MVEDGGWNFFAAICLAGVRAGCICSPQTLVVILLRSHCDAIVLVRGTWAGRGIRLGLEPAESSSVGRFQFSGYLRPGVDGRQTVLADRRDPRLAQSLRDAGDRPHKAPRSGC